MIQKRFTFTLMFNFQFEDPDHSMLNLSLELQVPDIGMVFTAQHIFKLLFIKRKKNPWLNKNFRFFKPWLSQYYSRILCKCTTHMHAFKCTCTKVANVVCTLIPFNTTKTLCIWLIDFPGKLDSKKFFWILIYLTRRMKKSFWKDIYAFRLSHIRGWKRKKEK